MQESACTSVEVQVLREDTSQSINHPSSTYVMLLVYLHFEVHYGVILGALIVAAVPFVVCDLHLEGLLSVSFDWHLAAAPNLVEHASKRAGDAKNNNSTLVWSVSSMW